MALSTKINQGFAAVGTKVKELDLSTVKSVNSVTPNSSGNVKITTVTGNAGSATKLQTARTISLTGDVTGSVSFDGTDNVSITATVTDDSHNHVISNIDNLQTTLDAKAPLASPTLTGTPKAPTATAGTNTTQIATTAFVKAAVDAKTSVTSATKATQDASGNVITSTYATKTELSTGLAGKSDTSHGHDAVTQSAAGFMSAADKKKLDGIAEGANNYTYTLPTASSTLGGVKTTSTVTSTSGLTACPIISGVPYYKDTNNTYTLSSFGVTATSSELNVLDGITATTAELNYVDGVTSNIQTQLNNKLDASGTAAKASKDASGNTITSTYATKTELTNGLNGKANSSHSHAISEVTNLQSTLDGKLGTSANAASASKWNTARTITLGGDASGSVSIDGSADKTLTVTVKDDSHNHIISNVDGLQTALDGKAAKENSVYFVDGTGTTEGAWLGTHADIPAYYQGLTIAYKVGIAGVSGGSTLNINNLGAVSVIRNNGSAITTHYGVGSILILTYDIGADTGTPYWKMADYDSDTKTRSSNKTGSKMYIIGATSQSTSGQTTYSNSNCYIGTDNKLYSGGKVVANSTEVTTALSDAKSYTDEKVAALVNSAPETMDTLGELATALQNNVGVTDALNTAISSKANSSEVVKLSGNQTIAGTKTFSSTISGSINGNAATATKATQDGSGNVITSTYLTKTDASSTYLGKSAKAASATVADSANAVAWGNVSGKPGSYTPSSHNQASNTINALTGYSKASSASALSTSDSLNSALGKLEKALDGKLGSTATASKATADASGNTITSTYATKSELTSGLSGKSDTSHTHSGYLPTSGGSVNGSINFGTGSGNGLAWGTKTNNGGAEMNPFMGYCTSSGDGTFVIGSLTGTTYQTGLALGGTSGNLLWKGAKVITADNVSEYANKYSLPNATSSTLGGVKVGSNISVSSGTISLTKDNVTAALGYTPPTTDTKYTHPSYTAKSSGFYKVTVDATGHVSATTAVTKADITGLGIPAQDTVYTLPNATSSVLGGVKIGSNITVSSGTISLSKSNVTSALGYTPPTQDTTYSAASQSAAGLMSATDKKKLDGIASGANAYSLPTASSSTLGGVKTTSTVTSTSGLTACPIISGVPYYKDTKNTYTLSSFSVTATAAELNVLDGITATTAELNFCDGVTSNIQTQLNGKLSTSGTAAKATADASGNTITSTYATKTELNGKANSATTLSGYGITDAYTKSQVQNNFLQGISTETNYDINKAFDGKMYMVKNGASCPSGSQYGVVLGMPYRQMAGNSKTDFGAQIFLPNGDDSTHPNSMFYRTSLGDAWNAWQEVATTSYVSSNYLGKTAKAASATTADSATKATKDGSGNTITSTYAKLSSAAFTGAISGTTATFSGAVKGASFQATSDLRKKSDLEKIENCLEKVATLTAYTYSLAGDDSGRRAGLIAQEVQKVLPEAIREDEQGFLSLDYNGVIGLILGSINELHEEIKNLRNNKN